MNVSRRFGFILCVAKIALLVGIFVQFTQSSKRNKVFSKHSSSVTGECHDNVTSFETNVSSVGACAVMCLNDEHCREITYKYDDWSCKGFHHENNSLICTAGYPVQSYIAETRYSYIGCFQDSGSQRAMTMIYKSYDMSNDICHDRCRLTPLDNIYFGTQNGNECFCGKVDTIYDRHGQRNESDCNRACVGNRTQICGAGWRNSVYRLLHYV